ncbi:MAG: ABC transporter permease [Mariniphaga sp.]|nr:ABC transporter permease [Mariniphaga sp.]
MYNVILVDGNRENILSEPYSIAVSQSFAKKLFGDEPALGKLIKENNQDIYFISGVFEDFPSTSYLSPEIVTPIYRTYY